MVARGGVEPPTFRFSGTCSAAGQRVRALIPLDDPDTTHGHTAGTSGDGLSRYAFADYLEQHLTRAPRRCASPAHRRHRNPAAAPGATPQHRRAHPALAWPPSSSPRSATSTGACVQAAVELAVPGAVIR